MPETRRALQIRGNPAAASVLVPASYTRIDATDATQLSQQLGEWSFELTQLKSGSFKADGGVLDLDGVSVARVSMSQTLLQRGSAPRGMPVGHALRRARGQVCVGIQGNSHAGAFRSQRPSDR